MKEGTTMKEKQAALTRRKLVEATMRMILQRGYAGTGVDVICAEAGVTKGAFFHYFKSKEEIGKAAIAAWGDVGMSIYSKIMEDPKMRALDRVYMLLGIMSDMADDENPVTCVVGMMSQETAFSSEALREASAEQLQAWVTFVGGLLDQAKKEQKPKLDFDGQDVAWMLHSLWQGSMLCAKTARKAEIIVRNLRHARAYLDTIFYGAVSKGNLPVKSPAKKTPTRKKK